MEDVKATVTVFQHPVFWERRMEFVEEIIWDENLLWEKNDGDSDAELSESSSSDSDISLDQLMESSRINLGNGQWFMNEAFVGCDAYSKFEAKRKEKPQTP